MEEPQEKTGYTLFSDETPEKYRKCIAQNTRKRNVLFEEREGGSCMVNGHTVLAKNRMSLGLEKWIYLEHINFERL
jgi:hypothetical protein